MLLKIKLFRVSILLYCANHVSGCAKYFQSPEFESKKSQLNSLVNCDTEYRTIPVQATGESYCSAIAAGQAYAYYKCVRCNSGQTKLPAAITCSAPILVGGDGSLANQVYFDIQCKSFDGSICNYNGNWAEAERMFYEHCPLDGMRYSNVGGASGLGSESGSVPNVGSGSGSGFGSGSNSGFGSDTKISSGFGSSAGGMIGSKQRTNTNVNSNNTKVVNQVMHIFPYSNGSYAIRKGKGKKNKKNIKKNINTTTIFIKNITYVFDGLNESSTVAHTAFDDPDPDDIEVASLQYMNAV